MTAAAMHMLEKKVWAQRSYRVRMRRQSLSFPNMFSILWRFLYSTGSCGIGTFRLALDGMQAVILRSARASRNQSASYPLSASNALALGTA
jgi:hypothetical protein